MGLPVIKPAFFSRRALVRRRVAKTAGLRSVRRLRCNPVFSVEIVVTLDTSVTFYSGFRADIIGVWQRKRAYVRSRVARCLQKERFSDAGSGTASTFLYGSFIRMMERQK